MPENRSIEIGEGPRERGDESKGKMEVSLLRTLLDSISRFGLLSTNNNVKAELVQRYCRKIDEILDLLKPVFVEAVGSEIILDEQLNKMLDELDVVINEAMEHVGSWHQMMSKVYFVLQIESVITRIQTFSLGTFRLLDSLLLSTTVNSTFACTEHHILKIQHMHYERISDVIEEAIKYQIEEVVPGSQHLQRISNYLRMSSNQELLMEVVALEKLKSKVSRGENYVEVEKIDHMIALVNYIHDCFVKINQLHSINGVQIPADFCCPLSLELMADPVILASGQTYERAFIKKWLDEGFDVCPKTRQTLEHTNLSPNNTVKSLIVKWCKSNDIKLSDPIKHMSANLPSALSANGFNICRSGHSQRTNHSRSPASTRFMDPRFMDPKPDLSAIETQVGKLVEDLKSDAVDAQRAATAELRLLAKHDMENRIIIANCGAISLLVGLLHSSDLKTQENAVTTLLNLSINDNNKASIANADAIDPLVHVLEMGNPEAKENSAATLFSLSVIAENKVKIGRSGAIRPLVDLLGNGSPRGKKDAVMALFYLSMFHENRTRIVEAGAVRHLVDLMDPAAGMVDKAVAVLANLASTMEGRNAIVHEGGIPVLVEVVELGSARGKENAAAALVHLCTNSNRFCRLIIQEGAVPPLVTLSQSGTPRAKEKAHILLRHFRSQRHDNAGRS